MKGRKRLLVTVAGLLVLGALFFVVRSRPSPILNYQEVHRPAAEQFKEPTAVQEFFTIKPVVRVKPHEESPDWLGVIYTVRLTNVSPQPILHFGAHGWLDAEMRPWISNDILQFGMMADSKPLDLIPGQVPYGLEIFRIVNIPAPKRLSASDVNGLTAALHQPMWLRLVWDKHEYLIRIPPEQIQFEGLDLLQEAATAPPASPRGDSGRRRQAEPISYA